MWEMKVITYRQKDVHIETGKMAQWVRGPGLSYQHWLTTGYVTIPEDPMPTSDVRAPCMHKHYMCRQNIHIHIFKCTHSETENHFQAHNLQNVPCVPSHE